MSEATYVAAPPLYPVPVVAPWHYIGIDLIGPIASPERGNQFILTVMDYFTKYADAIPLPDKSATGVATALFKVCSYSYVYISIKSHPSAFFPRQAVNSAISASIDAGLARNQSYVLWHLKVYF